VRALCALLLVVSVREAGAQPPVVDPPTADPHGATIAVAGELTATYGSADPGFFNYATYAYDPLRNVRLVVDASLRPGRRLELLAQLRTDGLSQARMSALYLRVRPWPARGLDVQVGRVPTAFGLFGRSGYGADSPLVGRPLAYAYLLSLRTNAVAATAADLVRMRGRGWLSSFPRGTTAADRGLPIVNTDLWDTGVQLRVAYRGLEWTGAVTAGSLGSPRLHDDNNGRSWSTRATWRPHPGIVVGASAADGAYLSRSLDDALGDTGLSTRLRHTARAADVEVSHGPWLLRGEILHSRWRVPAFVGTPEPQTLTATPVWGDARLRVLPGLDVAIRAEHVSFSSVTTASAVQPWEAPVTRTEIGLAYSPVRHLRLKLGAQRNRRPLGGRIRHDTLLAAQAAVWF
jgi:hypothetical protein